MIQNGTHAYKVQHRRYNAGLPGYARAVKRYFARTRMGNDRYSYKSLPALTKYEAWHPRHDQ